MASSSASAARSLARAKGREKPQLSCNFCRKRKLRCDRRQPCDSCTRLGQASSCSFPYTQPPITPRTTGTGTPVSVGQSTLQSRIDHLENLVRSLLERQNNLDTAALATPDASSSESTVAETENSEERFNHDFGQISLQSHESSYVESDHWSAILDEIGGLREYVRETSDYYAADEDEKEEPVRMPGADLFLMQTASATKMDIISAIPPRIVVDSMIARYFNTADMPISMIIHRNVFLKQYEAFWEDPLGTPILWVTILFGMMYMVAHFALLMGEGSSQLNEETLVEYRSITTVSREKMIQCLRLGNYMKGTRHTIEALLFFLQVDYVQGEDAQLGCWQLLGLIIRIALKMGYHRDGSHFPERLSAFDAEMRRRVWSVLAQFDTATSSQVGLPRLVKEAQCDTAEPRSLLDDDFDDDASAALPPARPPGQHTLAQFVAYKGRVTSAYGRICDFATSSRQRDHGEAMRLDRLLNAAYRHDAPAVLQPQQSKPLRQAILADGVELVTRRAYIAVGFYKAQMTLHRRFMVPAKTDGRFAYSHATCVGAALSTLRLQADLHEQCRPGGALHADRWKVWFVMQAEFLLATTILCFDLSDDIANARARAGRSSPLLASPDDDLRAKTVAALRTSLPIWTEQQAMSKDAQKAIQAITVVLNKAQRGQVAMQYADTDPSAAQAPPNPGSFWTSPTVATGPECTPGSSAPYQNVGDISSTSDPRTDGTPTTYTPSTTSFSPMVPWGLDIGSAGAADMQMEFGGEAWGELFDLDGPWDTWS
ncbi:hypothetical protein GGR56DRAFT_685544 [Xylariaceae sp. FL0804]|nr:hypothetical protein GGR56DRAFT_685544 [Xylariaceae sp. FL0804]